MIINRPTYLQELISSRHNGMIKIGPMGQKNIIVGEETPIIRTEAGTTIMSIYDFLLKENSLEQ